MKSLNEALATIAYTVGSVDGVFVIQEKKKLHNWILEHWHIHSESIFEKLKELTTSKRTASETWEDFKEYYGKNQTSFSAQLKKEILEMSLIIASASSARNKSELVLLSQLENLLKE